MCLGRARWVCSCALASVTDNSMPKPWNGCQWDEFPGLAARGCRAPVLCDLGELQELGDLMFGEAAFFDGYLAHGSSGCERFFGDSGGLVVADLRGERRRHGERLFDMRFGPFAIGG